MKDTRKVKPGYLTTHERFRLVLLRSRPDTVRRLSLHKTRSHTSVYPSQDRHLFMIRRRGHIVNLSALVVFIFFYYFLQAFKIKGWNKAFSVRSFALEKSIFKSKLYCIIYKLIVIIGINSL